MTRFTKSLKSWGTPAFEGTLKTEVEQLGTDQLPLQQGLSASSYALDDKLDARIISVAEEAGFIRAKVGIFYAGLTPGCSCADDPTPVEEQVEYCVMQLDIDKTTAETTVALVAE